MPDFSDPKESKNCPSEVAAHLPKPLPNLAVSSPAANGTKPVGVFVMVSPQWKRRRGPPPYQDNPTGCTRMDHCIVSRFDRPHFRFGRPFLLLLALAQRAFAALLASALLSSGLREAMRAFTPFPWAALPPFLPISRITSEIISRRILQFYDGYLYRPIMAVDTLALRCHN